MEPEQVVTEPTRPKKWTKIAIAVLAFMSFGQISAIFLPAIVAHDPAPQSLLGSTLWLGLLFMSIWHLNDKKKLPGFIVGAAIGLFLYFSSGVTASYLKAKERTIDQAVALSNNKLPRMLDDETQLDSVSIDQNLKNYNLNISLINLSQPEINVGFIHESFEKSIKPETCSNETFRGFLSENYKINYSYKDKEGQLIARYTVNPTDCSK